MKKAKIYIAAAFTVISAITAASIVVNPSEKPDIEVQVVRPKAPFIFINSVSSQVGTAIIGVDGFDVELSFNYETGVITDRVSGIQERKHEVTNIYDVVVRDLDGNKVADFTDYQDHGQFAQMINQKLMEY